MKLHPLHTPEMLAEHMLFTGCYPDPTRMTGRTTALALRVIARAIEEPHTWIQTKDHHGHRWADTEVRRVVQGMVAQLGLKHFTFRDNAVLFGTT